MVSLVKRRIVTDTSKIERTHRPENFRLLNMFLIILLSSAFFVSTQQREAERDTLIDLERKRDICRLRSFMCKELKIENKIGN